MIVNNNSPHRDSTALLLELNVTNNLMESVRFLPQPAGVLPLEKSFTCPPVPTLTLTPWHNDKDALAKRFDAESNVPSCGH